MNTFATIALVLPTAWSLNFITGTTEQRQSCTYYEAFGCIGDVMEKLCEGGEDGESAGETMQPEDGESAWLCCCESPYINCDPDSEMHQACLESMIKHVEPILHDSHLAEKAVIAVRSFDVVVFLSFCNCLQLSSLF